jgi:SecD/SecF fusion protein
MKTPLRIFIAIIVALQLCGGCYSPAGEYNAEFTLQVPVIKVIRDLSGNSRDSIFIESMRLAKEKQDKRNWDFVTLFGESWEEVGPDMMLASVFQDNMKDRGITAGSSNEEVLSAIRDEIRKVAEQSLEVAGRRLHQYVHPSQVKNLEVNGYQINVMLEGIDEPNRALALLLTKGEFGFWETFSYNEIYSYFMEANTRLRSILETETDQVAEPAAKLNEPDKATSSREEGSLLDELEDEQDQKFDEYAKQNPLNASLTPAIFLADDGQYYPGESATVGYAKLEDTASVNSMLRMVSVVFPANMRLVWSVKPAQSSPETLELFALKLTNRLGSPALGGDVILDARQDYTADKNPEVSIKMDSTGARAWSRITRENIGKQIAIVIDNHVYSCPTVRSEIPNGMSSISGGNMTLQEAQDISYILNSVPLPYALDLIDEKVTKRE